MDHLTLTIVQSNLEWQQAISNREILSELLKPQVKETDLIVLPEMFTSAFSMEGSIAEPWPGDTVGWMQSLAAHYDAALCGSIAILDDGKRFNRLVFVAPDGNVSTYDKRHLFRMYGEDKRYSAGSDRAVIMWQGWRIFPLVCYDLRFPVWCRNIPELDYDLIIFVANWPAGRNHHWQALLKARAIENLSYVAGVNRLGKDGNDIDYVGNSEVISPSGEILLDAAEDTGCFSVTINKSELEIYRDNFPTHMDADPFELK
jgi:predicted amidohydrolase